MNDLDEGKAYKELVDNYGLSVSHLGGKFGRSQQWIYRCIALANDPLASVHLGANIADITPTGFTFKLMDKDNGGNIRVNPKTKLIKKIKQSVITRLSKKADGEDSETVYTEIELHNPQRAAEILLKAKGAFIDHVEHQIRKPVEITHRLVYEKEEDREDDIEHS